MIVNFQDAKDNTIDLFFVPTPRIGGLNGPDGLTVPERGATLNEGAGNGIVVIADRLVSGFTDVDHIIAHEVGHALLDGGSEVHESSSNNLMNGAPSLVNGIRSTTKRLLEVQEERMRRESGPQSTPVLLGRE